MTAFFFVFQNDTRCNILLLLPQGKVRIKFVFIPLLNSWRICHLLGNTTGGGKTAMIPGLQTGRNSDDHVECQMSDLVRGGRAKFPTGPLIRGISNWWCGRWTVATVFRPHCSRMTQNTVAGSGYSRILYEISHILLFLHNMKHTVSEACPICIG